MPHTHHSHSGSFCAHADPASTLESMIARARATGMTTMCLTEHIPRSDDQLYPEEATIGVTSASLHATFDAYVEAAKKAISDAEGESGDKSMQLLLGFEAEWIDAVHDEPLIKGILAKHNFDMFIGSVHHVETVPIDFSKELFLSAAERCGVVDGLRGEDALFLRYFKAQEDMLVRLRPTVVGHIDLIRLFADGDRDLREIGGGKIWAQILRNLSIANDCGSLMEINTAGWRKGLKQPYPRREVLEAWTSMGGRVCLSDDSHAVSHVGTNYGKLLNYLEECKIGEVSYLHRAADGVQTLSTSVESLKTHPYWSLSDQ